MLQGTVLSLLLFGTGTYFMLLQNKKIADLFFREDSSNPAQSVAVLLLAAKREYIAAKLEDHEEYCRVCSVHVLMGKSL